MKRILIVSTIAAILTGCAANTPTSKIQEAKQTPLIVHEWGTITTHHFSDGKPLDKLKLLSRKYKLPDFVYKFEPKGATDFDVTGVTMRLETPVIYFYPPKDTALPSQPFDVSVEFHKGLINEFYPNAKAEMNSFGSLQWLGIKLTNEENFPETTNNTWLAPRNVHSTAVMTASGENEKYLFYRGVAPLNALFKTLSFNADKKPYSHTIYLNNPDTLYWTKSKSVTIPKAWLIGVRKDKAIAIKDLGTIVLRDSHKNPLMETTSFESNDDYSQANRDKIKASMKQALVETGLFEEEAKAMLATWEDSYFNTPGVRIFYIVPREWIDFHLPLKISVPHELTRVLVGRIDLFLTKPKAAEIWLKRYSK